MYLLKNHFCLISAKAAKQTNMEFATRNRADVTESEIRAICTFWAAGSEETHHVGWIDGDPYYVIANIW